MQVQKQDIQIQQQITSYLNTLKHIKLFLETKCAFDKNSSKNITPVTPVNNFKLLSKGNFWTYSSDIKMFKQFYFELFQNVIVKYDENYKTSSFSIIPCQIFQLSEESISLTSDLIIYSLTLRNKIAIAKFSTDKQQVYKHWKKILKGFCKLTQFQNRYQIDTRIQGQFYRLIDKKKKIYIPARVFNKKGLKSEQIQFIENEIGIIKQLQSSLLLPLKKVFEDDHYIYMTFEYIKGDDLKSIVANSKLEEAAVATLAYHIIKIFKLLHTNNIFHGNIKLENIFFSTYKQDNEIFLMNFKYQSVITEYLKAELIKKGQNIYIAPEILENKQFDTKIDMFSLGVCLYLIIFKKCPYQFIKRDSNKQFYEYQLDLSQLIKLQDNNIKNPNLKQQLSATGIDFLFKLLQTDPAQRPNATAAMNHTWFINQKHNKCNNSANMQSLRTIVEVTERDIIIKKIQNIIPGNKDSQLQLDEINIENDEDQEDFPELNIYNDKSSDVPFLDSEQQSGVQELMLNLNQITQPKQPSIASKQIYYQQNQITVQLQTIYSMDLNEKNQNSQSQYQQNQNI